MEQKRVFLLAVFITFLFSLNSIDAHALDPNVNLDDCEAAAYAKNENQENTHIESIYNACYACRTGDPNNTSSRYGTIWANSSSDRFAYSNNIINAKKGAEKVNVYLHGQYYTCRKNTNIGSADGMNAKYIKFTDNVGSAGNPGDENPYFEVKNDILDRIGSKEDQQNLVNNYTWSIPGETPAMATFNLKKYLEDHPDESAKKGLSIKVYIYRCPTGAPSATDASCWADSNPLTIIIKEDEDDTTPCEGCECDNSCGGGCEVHQPQEWINSNKYSGTTSTWSGVASNVDGFQNIDNQQKIWAKPGDVITFKHCYFPGAQSVLKSSGDHEEPTPTQTPKTPKKSDDPDLTVQKEVTTSTRIGEQDTPVETDNYFTISTSGQNLLADGMGFKLVDSQGFSAVGSNRFDGQVGKKDAATVLTTGKNTVKGQAAGKVISQSANTRVGTTSVVGHDTWNWNWTWTWQYTFTGDNTKRQAQGKGTGTGTHYNEGDNKWYEVEKHSDYAPTSSSAANVWIPYNYVNKTDPVDLRSEKIYAGQTFRINDLVARVEPKYNTVTQGKYATITPVTTIKLYSFYAKTMINAGGEQSATDGCAYYDSKGYFGCQVVKETKTTLNNNYSASGSIETLNAFSGTYAVRDLPAGYKFCVGASVWPAESNKDDKDMGNSGNNQTYYSKVTCEDIYKKPTFEVWGGNLYAAGGIKTLHGVKNNLASATTGDMVFDVNKTNKNIAFASWTEYSLVVGGTISGLASGTATAGGKFVSASDTLCKYSPLTMSNADCKNSNSGGALGKYSGAGQPKTTSETANGIRKEFLTSGRTLGGTKFNNSAALDLSDPANYTQKNNQRYTYITGDVTISASQPLEPNITHVIYATGNVIIASNLEYSDGPYTDVQQIPQYIIISDKSLYINSNVSKVASQLIIDKGIIYTCTNGMERITDPANAACSSQLKISGTVVAQKLKLDRTYGAATGNYSSLPAEIIDAGLVTTLWSGASESKAPSLHTVYTRELSPRY